MKKSLLLLGFILFLLVGCNHQECMIQELQNTLSENSQDEYRITVYFLSPYFDSRAPIPLEDLLNGTFSKENLVDPYSDIIDIDDDYKGPLTIFHLSGSETDESIRIIREKLRPEIIEPMEKSGKINARVYYILENPSGETLLDLLVYAAPDTIYMNGIEVKNNSVFYQIIYSCLGEQAELLEQYFNETIMGRFSD